MQSAGDGGSPLFMITLIYTTASSICSLPAFTVFAVLSANLW